MMALEDSSIAKLAGARCWLSVCLRFRVSRNAQS